MPMRLAGNTVTIDGAGTVEDALPMLEFLQQHKDAQVDLRTATALHSAVIQVLLAARPRLVASPEEPFLAAWVAPLLAPLLDGAKP